ncbi:MAG TPA: type II glyceraldehyde-3-phosphate dehydrogenase [Thermoplasmata archaeon]|nr:type II glyceraldehyde-3-phosphate dehydrogenase [Thermoplasmata archaeon]
MGKARVAVNGYGTIGKRVADAIARQPDMQLVGVAKTRPDYVARRAVDRGYPLYVAGSGTPEKFAAAGIAVAGRLAELLAKADVVIDASPEDVGRENRPLYEKAGVRAIYQGGEEPEVAEASFSALANFEAGRGKRSLRVVSCNTTGITRAVSVVLPRWGVEHWEVTLVRRAADPAETKRGPINGILPALDMPSHHGPDARTVVPGLSITTVALVVPTTLMHVHVNHVRLARPPKDSGELLAAFRATPRFHVFAPWEGVEGTPQAMEFARDRAGAGAPADLMENVLWERGLRVEGRDVHFFQAIHQESIVVPENVDAVRAVLGISDGPTSIATTDRALGIGAAPRSVDRSPGRGSAPSGVREPPGRPTRRPRTIK